MSEKNDEKDKNKTVAKITDREALAICNLCNLKLEYADLKLKEEDERDNQNHTIYSLLKQEIEAIINKSIESRVFYYEMGEQEENRHKTRKTPLYGKTTISPETIKENEKKVANGELDASMAKDMKDIYEEQKKSTSKAGLDQIKKEGGLVYGYFLGCKNGDIKENFLDNWEIAEAGDAYTLLTTYLKEITEGLNVDYVMMTTSVDKKDGEKIIQEETTYKVEKKDNGNYLLTVQPEIKGNIDKFLINPRIEYENSIFLSRISREDYEKYSANALFAEQVMQTNRLYPTRAEINKLEEWERICGIVATTKRVALEYLPFFSKKLGILDKLKKGISQSRWDTYFKQIDIKSALKFYNEHKPSAYVEKWISPLVKDITSLFNTELRFDSFLKTALTNGMITTIDGEKLKSKDLNEFLAGKIDGLVNYSFIEEHIESTLRKVINYLVLSGDTYKLSENKAILLNLEGILSTRVLKNSILAKYPSILNPIIAKIENYPYLSYLNLNNFKFGYVLCRNKNSKELVLCFRNFHDESVNKRIKKDNYLTEMAYLDLINRQIINKKYANSNLTVTGFDIGGELANIYRLMYDVPGKIYLADMVGSELDVLSFTIKDLANFYDNDYVKNMNLSLGTALAKSLLGGATKFILKPLLMGSSLAPWGLAFAALMGTYAIVKNHTDAASLRRRLERLYVRLCKWNFILCSKKSSCNKSRKNCDVLNNLMKSPNMNPKFEELLEQNLPIEVTGTPTPMKCKDYLKVHLEITKDKYEKIKKQTEKGFLLYKRSYIATNGDYSYFDSKYIEIVKKEYSEHATHRKYSIKEEIFLTKNNQVIKQFEIEQDILSLDGIVLRYEKYSEIQEISNEIFDLFVWSMAQQVKIQTSTEKKQLDINYVQYTSYKSSTFAPQPFPVIVIDTVKNINYDIEHRIKDDADMELKLVSDKGFSEHTKEKHNENIPIPKFVNELVFAIGINSETGMLDWQYEVVASKKEITEENGQDYLSKSEEGSKKAPYGNFDNKVEELEDTAAPAFKSDKNIPSDKSRMLEEGIEVHTDYYTKGVHHGRLVAALENETGGAMTEKLNELRDFAIPTINDYPKSFEIGFISALEKGREKGIKFKNLTNIPNDIIKKSEELLGSNIFNGSFTNVATFIADMGMEILK